MPVYRFSVAQYERMIEASIFSSGDRVELLEGWIVPKMPYSPPHAVAISLLQAELLRCLSQDWVFRIRSSITTIDSQPEPDVAVVRGPGQRYCRAHPGPRDVGVLIEVTDTLLAPEREVKARIYARARIPVYWIVNLLSAQVEVYTQPRGGKAPAYRQRQDYGIDRPVPVVIAGTVVGEIAVRDLLP
jgi:Uma2 family endonuclease